MNINKILHKIIIIYISQMSTLTRQHHELSNLHIAGNYFSTLATDDISRRYFQGESYASTCWSRFKLFFSLEHTINELAKFYPYSDPIIQPKKQYEKERWEALENGFACSVISVFTIFQLAKRGIVLPVLNQFGKYFKTHRLFRHYLYALFLPTTLLLGINSWHYVDQFEQLWGVHARRLNNKILKDPECAIYPPELREDSEIGCWVIRPVHLADLQKKWDNQTYLSQAKDYEESIFEAISLKESAGEEEIEEDAAEIQDQGASETGEVEEVEVTEELATPETGEVEVEATEELATPEE